MIKTILISLLISSLFLPLLFGLAKLIKRQMEREMRGPRRINKADPNTIPSQSFDKKYSNLRQFGFKSSKNKTIVITLFILIPIVAAFVGLINTTVLILSAIMASIIRMIAVIGLTNSQYKKRLEVENNILILKRSAMGLNDNNTDVYNHGSEFTVQEWSEEDEPRKVTFQVPVTFDESRRLSFIKSFSEKFSFNGYWRETEEGWENNQVTLEWNAFFNENQMSFVKNFLEFKKKMMGLANPNSSLHTYYYEVDELEWDEEDKPIKMTISIPIGYDTLNQNTFLDKLSIEFGRGRPWEIDEENGGWNNEIKKARLALQKALPDLAMFDEKYLLNDIVQWSYFPVGISSRGGVPYTDPDTGEEIRIAGFDVNGAQGKFMKKQGLFVGADLMPSPHAIGAGVTGGGKSVVQRSIILECLMRPQDWYLIIVDLKKVEGALYRKYGVPVATTYEDAAILLTFAQKVMMDRYEIMEKRGINNWSDMPEEERGPALMIDTDEAGELLAKITGSDDESKMNAEFQGQCQAALESIARLGRAARLHLTIFSQRPDSETISMQIRQNAPTRIACGSLPGTISGMLMESNYGATIPSKPQGRVGLKIHSSNPYTCQGFFADEDYLDKYLEENNLPVNIQGSMEMTRIFEENKAEAEAEDALAEELSEADYNELKNILGH